MSEPRRPEHPGPGIALRVAASPLPWLVLATASIAWALAVTHDASRVAIPLLTALAATCGAGLALLVRRRTATRASDASGMARDAAPRLAEDPIVLAMTGRPAVPRNATGVRPRTRGRTVSERARPAPMPVAGSRGDVVARPAEAEAPRHRKPNWVRRLEPTIAVEPETPVVPHND